MTAAPQPPRHAVLVVDDEVEIRSLLQVGLQEVFDVDCASSAEEAEPMLLSRRYDVILSDHLMGGEDGLPFLVRMSRKHPQVRRILMTSYINPELLARSTNLAGLSACLIKPVSMEGLITAIRQALAKPAPPVP